MNVLIDDYPDEYNNFKLNTDFRNCLKLEKLFNEEVADDVKINIACDLLLCDIEKAFSSLENFEKAIEAILWFYSAHELELQYIPEHETKIEENNEMPTKPTFNFFYDSQRIYTDFLKEYQINLKEISYLHWWDFLIMLTNLSDNSEFKKAIYYRTIKIDNKWSDKHKSDIKKLKKYYRIPDDRTKEQKEMEFAEALW